MRRCPRPLRWSDRGRRGTTWLLAVPVVAVPERVWILTAVCALVLIGSTLHVTSLLRERRNVAYARASRVVAEVSLVVVARLAWAWGRPAGLALVVPFILLAARAHKRDWSGWRPGRIGLVELACFVAVAVDPRRGVPILVLDGHPSHWQ